MIEVFANGLKFPYWTSATINRAIGNIAAAFSLSLVAKDGSGERVKLFPGDLVEVDVDGVAVVKGFVDKVNASFASGAHSVTVSGYEMTCDLVDCCLQAPLEWSKKKLDQIVDDICGRFGIQFANSYGVDVGEAFEKFSVEPGAKAVDAIGKLCKERGVLPCSDGMGKVYLIDPNRAELFGSLTEGVNIVTANTSISVGGLYSDYYIYGSGKAKKKVEAHVSDGDVVRSRPFVLVDANATEKASVDARANWERASRKAKGLNFQFSVVGWTYDGKPWEPGTLCSVYAPSVLIDDEIELLISQVSYTLNGNGGTTSITLVPPDAFEPQPEVKKGAKPKKVPASDVWAGIKKAVKG